MFGRGEGQRRSSGSGSVASGIHHPPRFAIQFRLCQILIHLIVEGYVQLQHTLARILQAPPLGGEATGEEGVLPVPTDLRDQLRGGLNACRRGAWNRYPIPGG